MLLVIPKLEFARQSDDCIRLQGLAADRSLCSHGVGMRKFVVRLMGPFALAAHDADAQPRNVALPPASRRLLACLALRGWRAPLAREALADMLWPESPPEKARSRLGSAVFRLRRGLGEAESPICEARAGVGLVAERFEVDFWTLNARVEAVRDRAPETLAAAEMAALELALHARTGPLLGDIALPACDPERFQCDENYEFGLETLMRYFRSTGRRDRSIAVAKRLVSIDPLREDVHATLIALYGEKGQRGLAAAQFSRCRALLEAELGLTPGAEVIASLRACLQPASGAPLVASCSLNSLLDEINLSLSLLQSQIHNLAGLARK
jgi:DNA-binding SARP family transcriptional activator